VRPLRLTVFILLSICSLRVQLHAQKDTSCDAPAPAPGQTKQQQQAAASGYVAACKAATAPDAHPLEAEGKPEPDTRNKGAAQVDDDIDVDVLVLPADPATWKVDDYLEWLRQKGCTKLRQQARDRVAGLPPDSQKDYLASMVLVMKKKNRCN
jgi:hypothetical protein